MYMQLVENNVKAQMLGDIIAITGKGSSTLLERHVAEARLGADHPVIQALDKGEPVDIWSRGVRTQLLGLKDQVEAFEKAAKAVNSS